jgi:hypothetical protein
MSLKHGRCHTIFGFHPSLLEVSPYKHTLTCFCPSSLMEQMLVFVNSPQFLPKRIMYKESSYREETFECQWNAFRDYMCLGLLCTMQKPFEILAKIQQFFVL